LTVSKVRERLAVCKQAAHKSDNLEITNLRKISKMEVRKEYQIKISNNFCSFGKRE